MTETTITITEVTPVVERPFKNRFISRYQKKLIEFAELPTAVTKIEFLKLHENFGRDFKIVYPEYFHYLIVSVDREKWLRSTNEHVLEMRKVTQDLTVTDRAFQAYYRRLYRTNRRLARKLRYRLRPNYFDNYLVNDFINTYNSFDDLTNPEMVKMRAVLIDLIARQIDLIIIRQVKRLKLYQFSTAMDDLLQEIRVACLGALKKFDISKGKSGREAFNYFSHICKKAGFMITLRHSDRRKTETPDSDLVAETLGTEMHTIDFTPDLQNNDKLSSFYEYFFKLFERKERMQLLLQILVYYILNVTFFTFKKNDFVKYACSYGFTPAFVNKFLNIMKSNRDKFEKDLDFDW